MSVSFYNFNKLHDDEFRNLVKERIGNIIDNNAYIEGEYNDKFEKEFALMQKAKHCLLVANGTDALEIALKVYDVKPGDRVGVPGITFYATAEAVLNIGAIPVWVDIEPLTGLICTNSLMRVHKEHKLKAVMPVHIYGLPAAMENINNFCLENNISIVEDAAQAHGATYNNGEPIGSYNNLTTFSFYPTKNLSAFGDAGCILTQSDELAEKIRVERNHGRGNEQAMGRNSRCDHMQAAVLHLKLAKVSGYNAMRKEVATKYHNALKNLPIKLLPENFLKISSWHLYPTQVESVDLRVKLSNHLKEQNIGHTPFYEKSLSQEASLREYKGESEKADLFAGRTLCLPIHPFVSDEEINYVANAVRNFFS